MSSPRTTRHPAVASLAGAILGAVALIALACPPAGAAIPAIRLGTAGSFAILAGSGITNTNATTIQGDVGTFPTPTITGFGSVVLTGTNHGGDAVTQQAKKDLQTAYHQAAGSPPTELVDPELGGRTLEPGVYHHDTLGLTGTLTLDTLGDPDAVFVLQADSTLITAAASAVVVIGGPTCNVFWQVGSSATLAAQSSFLGTLLVHTSISVGNRTTIEGRLLARNGAVTLDQDTITAPRCASVAPPGSSTSTTTTSTTTTTPTTSTTTPSTTTTTTTTTPTTTPSTTPPSTTSTTLMSTSTTATTVATPGGGAAGTPIGTSAGSTATDATTAAGTTTSGEATGGATPAGGSATTAQPGGPTAGLTELPRTGLSDWLPLVGAAAIALGLLLVRIGTPRAPLRHASVAAATAARRSRG